MEELVFSLFSPMAGKQQTSSSWSLLGAGLKKPLSSFVIFLSLSYSGPSPSWCSDSSHHSFVWSLSADNWTPLMLHVSFRCQDALGSMEGFIPAPLSVLLLGLLFTRLLAWWFFCDFIHSFICFFIP
jgi:hypothetical protein